MGWVALTVLSAVLVYGLLCRRQQTQTVRNVRLAGNLIQHQVISQTVLLSLSGGAGVYFLSSLLGGLVALLLAAVGISIWVLVSRRSGPAVTESGVFVVPFASATLSLLGVTVILVVDYTSLAESSLSTVAVKLEDNRNQREPLSPQSRDEVDEPAPRRGQVAGRADRSRKSAGDNAVAAKELSFRRRGKLRPASPEQGAIGTNSMVLGSGSWGRSSTHLPLPGAAELNPECRPTNCATTPSGDIEFDLLCAFDVPVAVMGPAGDLLASNRNDAGARLAMGGALSLAGGEVEVLVLADGLKTMQRVAIQIDSGSLSECLGDEQ